MEDFVAFYKTIAHSKWTFLWSSHVVVTSYVFYRLAIQLKSGKYLSADLGKVSGYLEYVAGEEHVFGVVDTDM